MPRLTTTLLCVAAVIGVFAMMPSVVDANPATGTTAYTTCFVGLETILREDNTVTTASMRKEERGSDSRIVCQLKHLITSAADSWVGLITLANQCEAGIRNSTDTEITYCLDSIKDGEYVPRGLDRVMVTNAQRRMQEPSLCYIGAADFTGSQGDTQTSATTMHTSTCMPTEQCMARFDFDSTTSRRDRITGSCERECKAQTVTRSDGTNRYQDVCYDNSRNDAAIREHWSPILDTDKDTNTALCLSGVIKRQWPGTVGDDTNSTFPLISSTMRYQRCGRDSSVCRLQLALVAKSGGGADAFDYTLTGGCVLKTDCVSSEEPKALGRPFVRCYTDVGTYAGEFDDQFEFDLVAGDYGDGDEESTLTSTGSANSNTASWLSTWRSLLPWWQVAGVAWSATMLL